jgi:hypothetical protein
MFKRRGIKQTQADRKLLRHLRERALETRTLSAERLML